jgi:hypothetical protein
MVSYPFEELLFTESCRKFHRLSFEKQIQVKPSENKRDIYKIQKKQLFIEKK